MKRFFSLMLSVIMIVSAALGTFSAYAGETIFGVDVSEWNDVINFNAAENKDKKFVMIRLGYYNHLDKKFWQNVENAHKAKKDFGVYLYSYAYNVAEAQIEAEFVIKTLSELSQKGYGEYFTLPVAYDLEDEQLSGFSKTQITNQMTTFCDTIKNAGYVPMVYANLNWFTNHINLNTAVSKKYKLWYAYWQSGKPDVSKPKEIGTTGVKADMWQYIDNDNKSNNYDQNVIFDSDSLVQPLSCCHNYSVKTTPATTSAAGAKTYTCDECGNSFKTAIAKISSSTLSITSTNYTGSVVTPKVTVKDSNGTVLSDKNDYTVTLPSGRKNVGRYSVKITYKGNYSGTQTLYFNIIPKNITGISKLTGKTNGFTVQWPMQKTQTTGYQIQYSTNKNFSSSKTITMSKNTYYAKSVMGLAANKTYYVRIRTYTATTFNGSSYNLYSPWCTVKSVKTSAPKATLSTTATYYNGKVKTPGVTVKDSAGKTLKKGTDYTVSFASGRKNVGRYAVKITYKGNYVGTQTLYFNIIPKNVSGIKKLTAGSKRFTVSWNPQKTQVTGYQIQYSTASNFKNAKTITMGKSSYSAKKVTGRMANKRYYVRIRTYKTTKFNGKNYNIYSPWCAKKSVVTKR